MLTAMPARSISVTRLATVKRCERRLAARFSAGRARNFIPKQSESYTVSPSAAN